ncbi:uncharacterized protein MONBRDRAFT_11528 [Monosiga brevicollis MX1]|uniref:DNA excision repair protein ERCC-6-like n=1 Tax=Monosiga brevicollis TaxID=81824 RepID=A9V9E8_MONBE|nr:uncharacterized protein MONBRDRAFT_11528 [Monosiga brevicollis MX1]EDQ85848.1 predicted protein [Monosiga brevicollis MX1]|eukprot:XP_001749327.1 hypothetical protein [Monosiga brevicollis MX1]
MAETSPAPALNKEERKRYNKLILRARDREAALLYAEAIKAYQQAQDLLATDPLAAKIERLEARLARRVELSTGYVRDDDNGVCWLNHRFRLPSQLYDGLFPHQREGVRWLWSLYRRKCGGILGDDMGLGKTVQVASYLRGLFDSELAVSILIVLPVSLLAGWERELARWAPDVPVQQYYGPLGKRTKALKSIQRDGGIILTTYGLVITNADALNDKGEHSWDCVILDEGHKIKNPSREVSKAIRTIQTHQRLILSGGCLRLVSATCLESCIQSKVVIFEVCYHTPILGTPMQNSLGELWALFDFVTNGELFGTKAAFAEQASPFPLSQRYQFENPITQAAARCASDDERERGAKVAAALRESIRPYFLRREKARPGAADSAPAPSVSANGEEGQAHILETLADECPVDMQDGTTPGPLANQAAAHTQSKSQRLDQLPPKHELIVWVSLSELQVHIYRNFLESDKVKALLNTTRSPLAALTVLKKLLTNQVAYRQALLGIQDGSGENSALDDSDEDEWHDTTSLLAKSEDDYKNLSDERLVAAIMNPSLSLGDNLEHSGKLACLNDLLPRLRRGGHRVLIFSQSRKFLQAVASVLDHHGLTFQQLDGSVKTADERQALVDKFNKATTDELFAMLLTTQVGGVGLTLTGANRVIICDPSWNPSVDAQAVDRAYRIGQTREVLVYRLVTCGTIEEKMYRKQIFKGSLQRSAMTNSGTQFRYFSKEIGYHPALAAHLAELASMQHVAGHSSHDSVFLEQARVDDEVSDNESEASSTEYASADEQDSSDSVMPIGPTPAVRGGRPQPRREVKHPPGHERDSDDEASAASGPASPINDLADALAGVQMTSGTGARSIERADEYVEDKVEDEDENEDEDEDDMPVARGPRPHRGQMLLDSDDDDDNDEHDDGGADASVRNDHSIASTNDVANDNSMVSSCQSKSPNGVSNGMQNLGAGGPDWPQSLEASIDYDMAIVTPFESPEPTLPVQMKEATPLSSAGSKLHTNSIFVSGDDEDSFVSCHASPLKQFNTSFERAATASPKGEFERAYTPDLPKQAGQEQQPAGRSHEEVKENVVLSSANCVDTNVCAQHKLQGIRVQRCRCSLSTAEKSQYDAFLTAARCVLKNLSCSPVLEKQILGCCVNADDLPRLPQSAGNM